MQFSAYKFRVKSLGAKAKHRNRLWFCAPACREEQSAEGLIVAALSLPLFIVVSSRLVVITG